MHEKPFLIWLLVVAALFVSNHHGRSSATEEWQKVISRAALSDDCRLSIDVATHERF